MVYGISIGRHPAEADRARDPACHSISMTAVVRRNAHMTRARWVGDAPRYTVRYTKYDPRSFRHSGPSACSSRVSDPSRIGARALLLLLYDL